MADSEHYFQAQKLTDQDQQEANPISRIAHEAAQMGRDRSRQLRLNWEQVKDDVMRAAMRAKFTQHVELGRLLLSRDDAQLIEHTTYDRYCGDGGDGSGRNMPGQSLMEIREELRKGGAST